jgi:hypothetical protein
MTALFPSAQIVALGDGLESLLRDVPAAAGVVQILGPEQQALLTSRPANMRRWVGMQLGPPQARKPGQRPATDLRPLATGVRCATSAGTFEQRVVYERWMAPLVPVEKRADLRPPAWLHLDPRERFPRLKVAPLQDATFGPWRDKSAAERALRALEKLLRLRPCDFVFEPHSQLPLGLGCFYAQVRTCAAPCLERIDEAGYRDLAQQALGLLTDPELRSPEVQAWLPVYCGPARAQALVVEARRDEVDLFPVCAGTVLVEHARRVPRSELEVALGQLAWDAGVDDRNDWVWLANWLHEPRRRAQWTHIAQDESAASRAARCVW